MQYNIKYIFIFQYLKTKTEVETLKKIKIPIAISTYFSNLSNLFKKQT
jgi:hypothetical protein